MGGGYKLNGNRNGYVIDTDTMFDIVQNTESNSILPSGIETPGVFSGIPVCTFDMVYQNWMFASVSTMLTYY